MTTIKQINNHIISCITIHVFMQLERARDGGLLWASGRLVCVEDKVSFLRSFQVTNQIEACAHARLIASCLALIMLFFPQ